MNLLSKLGFAMAQKHNQIKFWLPVRGVGGVLKASKHSPIKRELEVSLCM